MKRVALAPYQRKAMIRPIPTVYEQVDRQNILDYAHSGAGARKDPCGGGRNEGNKDKYCDDQDHKEED